MINLNANRDEYSTESAFLINLKKVLRSKGNILAKRAKNTLDVESAYKTLLPDYLYYRLFDEIGEPLEPLRSTYIINVEEIGGNGAYYIKYGSYRKDGNIVTFKIYPPSGLYIFVVTLNNLNLITNNTNIYSFTMPETDANIKIVYSTIQPITELVYYGYNIVNIEDIYSGSTLNVIPNEPFTVPFNNVGFPGQIWFATTREVTKQTATIGQQLDLSDTFQLFGTFGGYNVYRNLWITEIDTITFE